MVASRRRRVCVVCGWRVRRGPGHGTASSGVGSSPRWGWRSASLGARTNSRALRGSRLGPSCGCWLVTSVGAAAGCCAHRPPKRLGETAAHTCSQAW